MEILVFNRQEDLSIEEESVQAVVQEVLFTEKRATDEVDVYFVTREEISKLHKEFFDDPSPTDCISFPMDEGKELPHNILGEIFVCPKTAILYIKQEAEKDRDLHLGVFFTDPYLETTLYLVHGLLHLLGYDDLEEEERKKMRVAEKRHMDHLLHKQTILRKTTI